MRINPSFWKPRFVGAGIHLGISLLVAASAAWLVFSIWYPYPYREISGGRELFLLVVTVDVILGPLLTFAVFDRRKPAKVLWRDIVVIGLLQLAALIYGLHTVAIVRPVHLVFELNRFRVVHAIEVTDESLLAAPPEFHRLPISGPTLLSIRDFKDNREEADATMTALQGTSLSAQPALWQNYETAIPQVRKVVRPISELKSRFPQEAADIDSAISTAVPAKRPAGSIGYVPMIGRQTFWTALVDTNTAEVIAFVPIDSF
jgi:hypothetical protein